MKNAAHGFLHCVYIYTRMNGEKWQLDVCCCAKKEKKRKHRVEGKAEKYNIEKKKNEKKRDLWNIFFLVVENGKYTYSIEQ